MKLAAMKVSTTRDCFAALASDCLYHLHSLWLFTYSDMKTIIVPSLIFGIANALASEEYGLQSNRETIVTTTVSRAPLVLLYVWMNLLPFAINNQKDPSAIQEDKINKPWRALPSKRMTAVQAERLMLILYAVAIGLSCKTGGLRQSAALVVLGVWYNNLGGGDSGFLMRNSINAFGYVCFLSGAMEVALGIPLPVNFHLVQWFAILAGIILTTVHLQDMYDQAGDSMKGRKTVPLVIGDRTARRTTMIPMLVWGYLCPRLWSSCIWTVMLSLLLAGTVAARSLFLTLVEQDRLTFRVWNVWISLMFLLPLLNRFNF